MTGRIRMTFDGGIAEVVMNRPDKLNALDMTMFDALVAAGDALRSMAGLRAVVLSGAGKSFCAGIDLLSLQGAAGSGLADLQPRTHGTANKFQMAVLQWRELPVPVIAAVHGHALGGGFQIMLGADIRVVAPSARLAVREIHWGIVPDLAGTALMRSVARDDVIRELTYTGREFSGRDALSFGFATRLSGRPLETALALARDIAGANPHAIRAAKRLLNKAAAGAPTRDLLLEESREQEALIGSSNQREAVAANFAKRTPRFADCC